MKWAFEKAPSGALPLFVVVILCCASSASAQVSTSSPHQIGFYCPPYTESFIEGGYYSISTTTSYCIWNTGNIPFGIPSAIHYGGLFRGIVGNSTGAGNSMGLATQATLNRPVPLNDMQQGEPLFAAIWELRSGPAYQFDHQLFLNFFRDGSNPPPSSGWGVINWKWGELPPEECCSSVVFLPGLKGSVLKTGSDTLWPPTIWSDDVPQLALDENGASVNEIYVDGIVNTFYGTEIYAPFSEFLDGIVASGTINAWAPFPYDWRFSPEKIVEDGVDTETGVINLVEKIEQLANESQTKQVTIVAHSMGGLVGKALIKKLEEEGKSNLIDSFVMVGVPQVGTPQAVASILHGDEESILGGFIVHPAEVRAVAQHMPGAYSLLPSPRYFDDVTSPVITFDATALFTEDWRDFWGTDGITSYSEFSSFVTGSGVVRDDPPEELLSAPEILPSSFLTDASDLHTEYDNYVFPEHIRVVQVAGWGRPTTKSVEYREEHSSPSYRTSFTTEGDKTVVYPSAISSMADETYFFDIFEHNKELGSNSQHRDLLSTSPAQNIIQKIITEDIVENIDFVGNTKPVVGESGDQLIVSTHSPVVLGAYDALGNFTGVDPDQDLSAEFLAIEEGIPGSTFIYSNGGQYLFLPEEGTYQFVYKGTGNGSTTVEVGAFVADSMVPLASYSDIPTTEQTVATFTVDSESAEDTVIEVDSDSDGHIDTTVVPDGTELSLSELLSELKEEIQALQIKESLKKNLLKTITRLEKKIEQKKEQHKKTIEHIEKKISKQIRKGQILASDAEELLELLKQVENAL